MTQRISMDAGFKRDIANGVKRQTVRSGRRDIELGSIIIGFNDGSEARAVVNEVSYKHLGNVTHEEAELDGFEDWDALYKALKSFYPDISPGTEVTLIKFIVIATI